MSLCILAVLLLWQVTATATHCSLVLVDTTLACPHRWRSAVLQTTTPTLRHHSILIADETTGLVVLAALVGSLTAVTLCHTNGAPQGTVALLCGIFVQSLFLLQCNILLPVCVRYAFTAFLYTVYVNGCVSSYGTYTWRCFSTIFFYFIAKFQSRFILMFSICDTSSSFFVSSEWLFMAFLKLNDTFVYCLLILLFFSVVMFFLKLDTNFFPVFPTSFLYIGGLFGRCLWRHHQCCFVCFPFHVYQVISVVLSLILCFVYLFLCKIALHKLAFVRMTVETLVTTSKQVINCRSQTFCG